MNSGHQTLPLFPRSGGFPRSQSSRSTGSSKQRQQHAKEFITQKNGSFISYTGTRVNDLSDEILRDRAIPTSAHEDHRRRTIIVKRDQTKGGSFGFTLQTYGIRHRDDAEVELITYVDSVEPYGSAARAGMRAGDVLLSINGQDVQFVDHNRLIQLIQACRQSMRIVVLFEDCVRRVALHVKLMQLQRKFEQKVLEYNHYVEAERNMLETLRNKGVDTASLEKGSTELLTLTESTNNVSFPFKRHSKSFNRSSVSHSKSESRLLSDSSSNLASSSTIYSRPLRDTSASCSTLPRRKSSARSLPSSVVVTPVGSLDGLEKGTTLSSSLPCLRFLDSSEIEEALDDIVDQVCEIVAEVETIPQEAIEVSLESIRLTDELPLNPSEQIVSYAFVDNRAPPCIDYKLSAPFYSRTDSGYFSIFEDESFYEKTKKSNRPSFPRKHLRDICTPIVALFDCICSFQSSETSEGHPKLLDECRTDLDRVIRLLFCVIIAACSLIVTTNLFGNPSFSIFYVMTLFFLGL